LSALEAELGCADVLMLVASVRGAVNGLTSELLEDHIRHHVVDPAHEKDPDVPSVTKTFLKSNYPISACAHGRGSSIGGRT